MKQPPKHEVDERRRAAQRHEIKRFEQQHDLVPGTAQHDGRQPRGGVEWPDRARMALARDAAGLALNDTDREAIRRCPNPPSGVTGAAHWMP